MDGKVEGPIERETTDKLSSALMAQTVDVGNMDEHNLIEQLAARVVEKERKAQGRTLFGLSSGDLIKFLVAVTVAVGTAYIGIQAALTERPTVDQVEKAIDRHSTTPHPPTKHGLDTLDERLDGTERKLDIIDVRQQQTLDVVKEIKEDVKDRRRRR